MLSGYSAETTATRLVRGDESREFGPDHGARLRYLGEMKRELHLRFMHSILQRKWHDVGNFAYIFDEGASGPKEESCDAHLPTLVIAKKRGDGQCGVLIPNPRRPAREIEAGAGDADRRRRVAATPRLRHVRGEESRRRRGCDMSVETSRGDAAAWTSGRDSVGPPASSSREERATPVDIRYPLGRAYMGQYARLSPVRPTISR